MKIGVYTLPFTWNYGGILQFYALKSVLESEGHDVVLLNRRTDTGNILKNGLKRIKWNLIPFFNRLKIFDNNPLVCAETFKRSNIKKISPLFFRTADLMKYCDCQQFDVVIVGSDQIWRYGSAQDIYSSYLDFVNDNVKKIAYAVSFGVDKWEYSIEATRKCKLLASKFDLITVRENSGVGLCNDFLGVSAINVLDPTLLAGKFVFEKLINFNKKHRGVYSYILDKSEKKTKMIDRVGTKYNGDSFSLDDMQSPSVENWITGFYYADYVVTDSFHGTCFAILYNKPFISIYNKKRGNARFESLLGQLGLTNRLVDENDSIDNLICTHIDYDRVNSIIERLRDMSKNLLLDHLHGFE